MSLIIDAVSMCLVDLMNNPELDASVFPGLRDMAVNKPCEVLTLKELQSDLTSLNPKNVTMIDLIPPVVWDCSRN